MTKKILLMERAPGKARPALSEQLSLKADLLARVPVDCARANCPELRVHRTVLLGRDEAGELRPLMEL